MTDKQYKARRVLGIMFGWVSVCLIVGAIWCVPWFPVRLLLLATVFMLLSAGIYGALEREQKK